MTLQSTQEIESRRPQQLENPDRDFKLSLPAGHSMGWKPRKFEAGEIKGEFILRNDNKEVGHFKAEQGKTVEQILVKHITVLVVGQNREEISTLIVLSDSYGKPIGSWEYGQETRNQVESLIKVLADHKSVQELL